MGLESRQEVIRDSRGMHHSVLGIFRTQSYEGTFSGASTKYAIVIKLKMQKQMTIH